MKKLKFMNLTFILTLLLTACAMNNVVTGTPPRTYIQEKPTHSNQSEKPEAEENQLFSIIWMTDTQYYSEKYPEIFLSMSKWIVNNKSRKNIQYVIHTGDVVNKHKKIYQWENADKALKPIMKELPLFVVAGNHDTESINPSFGEYAKRYGLEVFSELPSLGGFYEEGMGRYDLFEYGSQRFIIAGLAYIHTQEAIDWLNDVLDKYSDRIAILCFHSYMASDGSLNAAGEKLFESVVKNNANVQLVLCGHRHGSNRLSHELDDDGDGITDRIVQAILGNYQEYDKGGAGYLRIIEFDAKNNEASITAYSPHLGNYRTDDLETFTFSFSFSH